MKTFVATSSAVAAALASQCILVRGSGFVVAFTAPPPTHHGHKHQFSTSLLSLAAAQPDSKRIVLIRHGCTHMNEYLSQPGTRWGDATFTDVFEDPADLALYRDSPLSSRGVKQAQRLSDRIRRLLQGQMEAEDEPVDGEEDMAKIIKGVDLIACSPLTRALQTTEIALVPHFPGKDGMIESTDNPSIPIMALPLASERVYLISDLGRHTEELNNQFPYVDFGSCTQTEEWWWSIAPTNNDKTNYVEWRPNNEGQTYACLGEPEVDFNQRMAGLYDWLDGRDEETIALVCHWGVIDWLTGEDFDNCEMKVVDFASMRRTGFMLTDEEAADIFAQGERCVVRDGD